MTQTGLFSAVRGTVALEDTDDDLPTEIQLQTLPREHVYAPCEGRTHGPSPLPLHK